MLGLERASQYKTARLDSLTDQTTLGLGFPERGWCVRMRSESHFIVRVPSEVGGEGHQKHIKGQPPNPYTIAQISHNSPNKPAQLSQ